MLSSSSLSANKFSDLAVDLVWANDEARSLRLPGRVLSQKLLLEWLDLRVACAVPVFHRRIVLINRWRLAVVVHTCLGSSLLLHFAHQPIDRSSFLVVHLTVLGGLQQVALHVLLLREQLQVLPEVPASVVALGLVLLYNVVVVFVADGSHNPVV